MEVRYRQIFLHTFVWQTYKSIHETISKAHEVKNLILRQFKNERKIV